MKERVASAFGLQGSVLEGVQLAGRIVDVVVDINDAEWLRRRARGQLVSADRDTLRLLAQLPYRERVALDDIDPFIETLLRSMGENFLSVTESHVERIWTPALDIRGFLVVSANWSTALRRVSLFAADAPRAVAYTGSGRLTEARRRAGELGVGLASLAGEEVEVLVDPERHLVRHDEIRWALAEKLFRLWEERVATG